MKPLRVIINAQLPLDGSGGGVQQFTVTLIRALGNLHDASEEYLIVGPTRNQEHLASFLGPNQFLIRGPGRSLVDTCVKRVLRPFKNSVAATYLRLKSFLPQLSYVAAPRSNGFFESLKGDIVHFPYQEYYSTSLPSIYNPHDLLHLNYPEFLPVSDVAYREMVYRTACLESQAIAAESRWARQDIISKYGVPAGKVTAVLRGSPTQLYSDISQKTLGQVRERFDINDQFALYPAQTWPHKNHLRLIEAVKLLRDSRNISLKIICVGHKNNHWHEIERHIKTLGVVNLISFPGFVDEKELRALYRLAQFVVFPSLFEGGGFPVLEAFSEMTPLSCSTATSLPEYAGDAALFFDPTSVDSIALALERMTTNASLRSQLREKGIERARLFDWETTAKTYRALYRKVAGRQLSEEDVYLLSMTQQTDNNNVSSV